MSEDRIQELINKYLSNTISTDEWNELDAWYKSIGERTISSTDNLNDEENLSIPKGSRLSQVMSADLKKRNQKRYYSWSVAVAATILIVMGITLFLSPENHYTKDIYKVQADQSETRFVLLPDSSKVLLRPGSHIEVNYTPRKRIVKLTGEAFFDVTRQTDRPFIVYSGKFSTEVLGTKFMVKPNGNEGIMVSVQSGKVSVNDEHTKRQISLLHASEGVKVNMDTQDAQKTKQITLLTEQSANAELAWVDSEMVFSATPFEKIISKLEVRYDIKIVLTDQELRQRRLTGQFNGTETVDNVLEALTSIAGVQYKLKDGKYHIY